MDQLRDWYGTYKADIERVWRFWEGEGRVMVSLYATEHEYRQCFGDEEVLNSAPVQLRAQAGLPGLNLPSLYCDWGTVSTARYWGGETRFDSTGGNIFIVPVAQTVDEALALEPLAVDGPSMDAQCALRLYRRLLERLDTDALWLRTPDMQGTLNTAGLVLNQEEMLIRAIALGLRVREIHQRCRFLRERLPASESRTQSFTSVDPFGGVTRRIRDDNRSSTKAQGQAF